MQNQLIEQRSCMQKTKSQLPENLNPMLCVEDLVTAEKAIVAFVQEEHFSEEISALKRGNQKRNSHLYKLDPEIEGLLRLGGRLSRSCARRGETHCHFTKI